MENVYICVAGTVNTVGIPAAYDFSNASLGIGKPHRSQMRKLIALASGDKSPVY